MPATPRAGEPRAASSACPRRAKPVPLGLMLVLRCVEISRDPQRPRTRAIEGLPAAGGLRLGLAAPGNCSSGGGQQTATGKERSEGRCGAPHAEYGDPGRCTTSGGNKAVPEPRRRKRLLPGGPRVRSRLAFFAFFRAPAFDERHFSPSFQTPPHPQGTQSRPRPSSFLAERDDSNVIPRRAGPLFPLLAPLPNTTP